MLGHRNSSKTAWLNIFQVQSRLVNVAKLRFQPAKLMFSMFPIIEDRNSTSLAAPGACKTPRTPQLWRTSLHPATRPANLIVQWEKGGEVVAPAMTGNGSCWVCTTYKYGDWGMMGMVFIIPLGNTHVWHGFSFCCSMLGRSPIQRPQHGDLWMGAAKSYWKWVALTTSTRMLGNPSEISVLDATQDVAGFPAIGGRLRIWFDACD